MRYCLAVYLDNEYYEVNGYSKIPGFEHINEKKIKDIVSFTNKFDNEQSLICYLIETNLLPEKYFLGNVSINFHQNKETKPKKLEYGVSFKEDKKYFDTIFLKYYFSKKMHDVNFIECFIKKYYDYLKNVGIFSEELAFIKRSYNCLVENQYLPEAAEYYMTTFVSVYCRKKGKDGDYKGDYRKIRDLAMFAIDYERNYEKPSVERPTHTPQVIKSLIDHYCLMLENPCLEEEIRIIYTNKVTELEKELEFIQQFTLSRRKNDASTQN